MAQEKLDYSLSIIPTDLVPGIFQLLMQDSQNNLALTSKMFGHSIFQKDRLKTRLLHYIKTDNLKMVRCLESIRPDLFDTAADYLKSKISDLFQLAGFGKQEQMAILLKADPGLFYIYAPLKDISNVHPVINKPDCTGITVFQHAFWTGDMNYMCNMMLDCLPANAFGETIKTELLRQYHELMEYGVVYKLNGKPYYEKQFSVTPLINAVENYIANYYTRMDPERKSYWLKPIGLLQNFLPAIIRHHYRKKLDTTADTGLVRSLDFINFTDDCKKQSWDDRLQDLGKTFAMSCLGATGESAIWCAKQHLQLLTELQKTHLEIDLPALLKRLENPILSPVTSDVPPLPNPLPR